ncbi:universal stress protein [Haloarchaeobius sp. HRN-SO-5]|uniref:universal stress protein n=1 Tax=Haloarchaeobius sp. HRN-SO-5 TaxID=3446118 RepID=UPI003EBEAF71
MKFLVAMDGSTEAREALEFAADLAVAVDGTLTAVHAVDPDVFENGGSEPIESLSDADRRLVVQSVEDAEDRGLDILEDVAALADELGCDIQTELLYGDPVAAIPEFAEAEEFDAIFVGHRGRSARTESMLGSVAKGLVEGATVPVTVVR